MSISRRTAIALTGAASLWPQLSLPQEARRGLVFLPGIMGSTLSAQGSKGTVELWSRDVFETYRSLIIQPNQLRYRGIAAPFTELYTDAYLHIPGTGNHKLGVYYSSIVSLFNSCPFYGMGARVCVVPYDWRRSVLATADYAKKKLLARFGTTSLADLGSESSAVDQIDIVAHSLGALVALSLIGQQGFPQSRIRSITLIAPPLLGSPRAFRNLFDLVSMPVLDDIVFRWFGKNGSLATDTLHDVFSTFESLYELMPRKDILYIKNGNASEWSNPFLETTRLRRELCEKAMATHEVLAKIVNSLAIPKSRLNVFTGVGTDTDFRYHVTPAPSALLHATPFKMSSPSEITLGDGTVSLDSATWHSLLSDRANHYPIVGVEHSKLCEARQVLNVLDQILAAGGGQ